MRILGRRHTATQYRVFHFGQVHFRYLTTILQGFDHRREIGKTGTLQHVSLDHRPCNRETGVEGHLSINGMTSQTLVVTQNGSDLLGGIVGILLVG